MAAKMRATAIGIFVLAGCCLGIVMIIAFGGRNLFAAMLEYRLYFDKSVKGLSIGSPVMFRGVRIGQVSDICLSYRDRIEETSTESWPIEVTIQLQPAALGMRVGWQDTLPESIRNRMFEQDNLQNVRNLLQHMVETEGLRAQLQSLSLLTGSLFIELNFYPDSAWTEQMGKDLGKGILPVEISAIERLKQSFIKKDFSNHLDMLTVALQDLSGFINAGKFRKLLEDMSSAADNANQMMANGTRDLSPVMRQAGAVFVLIESVLNKLEKSFDPLLDSAQGSMREIVQQTGKVSAEVTALTKTTKGFVERLERITADHEPDIQALVENLRESSDAMNSVLKEVKTLVEQLKESSAPDSNIQADLKETLSELEKAALSMRSLAEFLRRNPESLLHGKGEK
ncbi:MAG: MlaD family protein [Lentisphaeria bacterium]|nr:MlaD family protein [Lentisphaeria bacterium]